MTRIRRKKDFLDEIIEDRTKKNKEFPNMVNKAVEKQRNENPDCTDYDDEGRCNQCGQFNCYECQWGGDDEAYEPMPELTKEDTSHDLIQEAKIEAARAKDQWVRIAADYDNLHKRVNRDINVARNNGRDEVLKEFLPVFDNIELTIKNVSSDVDVKVIMEGLLMITKQVNDTLARIGIMKVPAVVGSGFDPSMHEAIQSVEADEYKPGAIVSEIQPGYKQGDRLIRAAKVVVSKQKEKIL